MNCKFCGKKKKHGRTDICSSCFNDNVEGCKTEYNRRYKPNQKANIECRFKCGRKTRNHETEICVTCARSTRRQHKIKFADTFDQMRANYESRWKRLGIVYSEEQLQRHIDATQCDFCGDFLIAYKAMDHDHVTNHYRGTLCRKCNVGLGQLSDDLDLIIQRATAYKKRCA